jgi:two-component system, NtrC family, response regulator HydG
MKATDLHLHNLLQDPGETGIVNLLGHRVLIFDAMALGLLRKELIDSMGQHIARCVLSRFGFAHGWRTAESLKKDWPDLFYNDAESGPRLHMMHGLLTHIRLVRGEDQSGKLQITATWKDSYEAEQHCLHFGQPDEPVCWTLAAFISGYVSNRLGQECLFIETQCTAQGEAHCTVEGRLHEHWGPEYQEQFSYFREDALDYLLPAISRKLKDLEQQVRQRQQQIARIEDETTYRRFSAKSPVMRAAIDLALRLARTDASVVISGESGVGKEKFARLIHEQSSRSAHPFVAINCGALPEHLLESELFGYAKGAFTDATTDRSGLFEAAEGGTIFLDEIGEIPLAMQVKLLRVLQEREIRRIGESRMRAIDIRILSATNKNLAEEVAAGRFRQDLYYRLRVIELTIPPLRERVEDILPLAKQFLKLHAHRQGQQAKQLSPEAARCLLHHDWPGNVREIQNSIEYAMALATSEQIGPDDLPQEFLARQLNAPIAGIRPLREVEQDYILSVLAQLGGNKTKAAQALGIGLATLYRRIKVPPTHKSLP